jgi:hypothetical protein
LVLLRAEERALGTTTTFVELILTVSQSVRNPARNAGTALIRVF